MSWSMHSQDKMESYYGAIRDLIWHMVTISCSFIHSCTTSWCLYWLVPRSEWANLSKMTELQCEIGMGYLRIWSLDVKVLNCMWGISVNLGKTHTVSTPMSFYFMRPESWYDDINWSYNYEYTVLVKVWLYDYAYAFWDCLGRSEPFKYMNPKRWSA